MPDEEGLYTTLRAALEEHASADEAARSLVGEASALLVARRAGIAEFEAAVLDRWGVAFDAFELLLSACLAIGVAWEDRHGQAAAEEDDQRVRALREFWAASCLAGSEVLVLLRSGHAGGAFARWRTLHELAVLAVFIGEHDQGVADRLWTHSHMRGMKSRRDYQLFAEAVGGEPLSRQEMREMGRTEGDLRARYGEEFGGDYGWAHEALLAKPDYADDARRGKRPRGPFLTDLAAAVHSAFGPEHSRLAYALASHSVHAVLGGGDVLYAAEGEPQLHLVPSADGLEWAGSRAAWSLWLPAAALVLAYREDQDQEFGSLAQLLGALAEQANETFGDESG